jgi:hypothetical protein
MSSRKRLLAGALMLYIDLENDMDILALEVSKKRKECSEGVQSCSLDG